MTRDLLAEGSRELPDRQQSLTNTIAWSYNLLDDPDRRVFEAISVFAGGFRLDAATAVLEVTDDLALAIRWTRDLVLVELRDPRCATIQAVARRRRREASLTILAS